MYKIYLARQAAQEAANKDGLTREIIYDSRDKTYFFNKETDGLSNHPHWGYLSSIEIIKPKDDKVNKSLASVEKTVKERVAADGITRKIWRKPNGKFFTSVPDYSHIAECVGTFRNNATFDYHSKLAAQIAQERANKNNKPYVVCYSHKSCKFFNLPANEKTSENTKRLFVVNPKNEDAKMESTHRELRNQKIREAQIEANKSGETQYVYLDGYMKKDYYFISDMCCDKDDIFVAEIHPRFVPKTQQEWEAEAQDRANKTGKNQFVYCDNSDNYSISDCPVPSAQVVYICYPTKLKPENRTLVNRVGEAIAQALAKLCKTSNTTDWTFVIQEAKLEIIPGLPNTTRVLQWIQNNNRELSNILFLEHKIFLEVHANGEDVTVHKIVTTNKYSGYTSRGFAEVGDKP